MGTHLRPWAPQDLPLLHLANTPEMTEHLGGPETDAQVAARHAKYLRGVADGSVHMYVVTEDGADAGSIGWWDSEWKDEPVHEAGWFVAPEHQGRGVATRALGLVAADAAANGRHPHLMAFPSVTNEPSNRLCAACGFTRVGTLTETYRGATLQLQAWALELRRDTMEG